MRRVNQHPPITPDEQAQICALYADGHSIRAVAGMVGRSRGTVVSTLAAAGIEQRPGTYYRGPLPEDTKDKIAERRRALLAQRADDIAFDGIWVRKGLTWVGQPRQADDDQRQWAQERRSA